MRLKIPPGCARKAASKRQPARTTTTVSPRMLTGTAIRYGAAATPRNSSESTAIITRKLRSIGNL